MQFIYHSLGIGPVFGIKVPVALIYPMKEVDYYNIGSYPAFLIFSCCLKKFILCTVAQLALPQPVQAFGQRRSVSRDIGIISYDSCGCITCYVSSGASGWRVPFRTEAFCHYEVITLKAP